MRKLLALDLATESSGWATFDLDTKKLLNFGIITAKSGPGNNKYIKTLGRIKNMAKDVVALLDDEIEIILIEEINPGKNRLGQKTLSGQHFILMDALGENLRKIKYIDSDGAEGWRTSLGLKFSLQQRIHNKELKRLAKSRETKLKNKDIITKKHLCIAYVNKELGLSLTEEQNDAADAIGLGLAFFKS